MLLREHDLSLIQPSLKNVLAASLSLYVIREKYARSPLEHELNKDSKAKFIRNYR